MTEEDALKIAVYVLHHSDEDKLRAGEIISRALNPSLRALWSGQSIELPWQADADQNTVAANFARRLAQHVRAKSPAARVIEGTTTGWKIGPKAALHLIDVTPTLQVTTSKLYLGLSGEYAVMSELLALDWNVAKPPLDNGVDLFATKKGEVRTVQVKTATLKNLGDGRLQFSGSKKSHDLYNTNDHYYILVFRLIAGTRWQNTFYVCRSAKFDQLLHTVGELDADRDKWTLSIQRQGNKFLVGGVKDITDDLDRLETRFV